MVDQEILFVLDLAGRSGERCNGDNPIASM